MRHKPLSPAFSLIEILVVLIILGIITAVAVIAFNHFGRDRRASIALEQVQAVVALAQQRAMLQSIILKMVLTTHGYQFYQYQQSIDGKEYTWQPLVSDHLSNKIAFPKGEVFFLKLDPLVELPARLKKSSTSAVLFFPEARLTPFKLTVRTSHRANVLTVDRSGRGEITH